jgi:alanine-glyoxylate transaminase/serine-glyoxylate transaminase/serine-pyruvate transaminase
MERYGGKVTQLRAPVGGRPSLEEVEKVLRQGGFKLLVVTHVDTSTGVITEIKSLASLAHDHGAMIVVDGVCSVAGEELRMTEWNIDVALTASQKAIGVPPGLALFVARPQALQTFKGRKTPVLNYYGDWGNWLPVMQAYEGRQLGYFGTPAVNLIWALNVSLGIILLEGMEARFTRHVALSNAFKAGIGALGLSQVPRKAEFAAHMLTAARYPQGVEGSVFLPKVAKAGAFLAGGLHPAIKNEYFRIGHMGSTQIGEVLATLGAIEVGLKECGYKFQAGAGVEAAVKSYLA